MKTMKLFAGMLSVAAVMAAQVAFGAGFGIYEGSARGNAMGSEVTADPASPSVLYNNAAAMTDLEGTQVEAGATFIKPRAAVNTIVAPGVEIKNYGDSRWWVPPHAYVTHQMNDKVWAGVGVFSRFGLGVEYKDNWPGRYSVQEATIQSVNVNPSVAYKLCDRLSLGAGLSAQWFEFEMKRAIPMGIPYVDPDLQMHVKGDSWGLGYNLGAYFKATEWLSLGLAFESEVDQEVEGDYSVRSPLAKVGGGEGGGDVTTPGIIRLGASIKATEKLTVNAGVVYTMWSSYDQLAIEFDPPLLGLVPKAVSEKDWHDAFRWQLGVEYALTEAWSLRAGYVHDRTPDPDRHADYIVPANHRNLFTTGVGYKKGDFFCDLGYTYLYILSRDVTGRPAEGVLSGSFVDGDAHLVSASIGYKL